MPNLWRAPNGVTLDLTRPLLDAAGTVWVRRTPAPDGSLMLTALRPDGTPEGCSYTAPDVWRNFGPLAEQAPDA